MKKILASRKEAHRKKRRKNEFLNRLKKNSQYQRASLTKKQKRIIDEDLMEGIAEDNGRAMRKRIREKAAHWRFDKGDHINVRKAKLVAGALGIPKIKRKYLGKKIDEDIIDKKKTRLDPRSDRSPQRQRSHLSAIDQINASHRASHSLAGVDKSHPSPTIRRSFRSNDNHSATTSSADSSGHLGSHSGSGRVNSSF